MTDKELQNKLDALPEPVQDYLYDEDVADLNAEIIRRNDLREEQYSALFRLLKELFVEEVPLTGLVEETKKRFEFDDAKAKRLALDIAGFRLLPLDVYLGDVDGFIRSNGGDPSEYPKTRVQVEERTKEEAVEDVTSSVGADALPHRLRGRLQDVVRSYFAGVRTEEQLLEILARAEKIGGVGLDLESARKIVEEAEEERRTVVIAERKTVEKRDAEGAARPLTSSGEQEEDRNGPHGGGPKPSLDAFAPEDEEEIQKIAKRLPLETVESSERTDAKIRESVDELYRASGVTPPTEDLQNRLRRVIENRLRDVRDQMETLETLVQPKELGGLGLSQDDARRVIGLIENKLRSVHERHQEEMRGEKRAWAEKQAQDQLRRVEQERLEQRRKADEAFRNAVAGSPKAQKNAKPAEVPVAADRPAVPAPPAKTVAAPVPATTPAPVPSARPKMEDVKFQPKLTGPVEELQSLSVEDFRRLSKDPREAALKIKDKIDLLGEDSFDLKMQGVSAWNRSGVQKTYLAMMGEALEGTPMDQVIERRKASGEAYLSKEEVAALVDLGNRLRA